MGSLKKLFGDVVLGKPVVLIGIITLSIFAFLIYNIKYPVLSVISATNSVNAKSHSNSIVSLPDFHNIFVSKIGSPTSFSLTNNQFDFHTHTFSPKATNQLNHCHKELIFPLRDETHLISFPQASANTEAEFVSEDVLIDPRFDLEVLETRAGWKKIRTINPSWPPSLSNKIGWVRAEDIHDRSEDNDSSDCLFINFDLWQGFLPQFIKNAKEAGHNILSSDKRCRRIVSGGFLGSGQRFYLTCYPDDGGNPYHYWFSLMNLSNPISVGKRPSEETALAACKTELIKIVTNKINVNNVNDSALESTDVDVSIQDLSYTSTDLSWHVTISYQVNYSDERKSYCYIGPSGKAEITL